MWRPRSRKGGIVGLNRQEAHNRLDHIIAGSSPAGTGAGLPAGLSGARRRSRQAVGVLEPQDPMVAASLFGVVAFGEMADGPPDLPLSARRLHSEAVPCRGMDFPDE